MPPGQDMMAPLPNAYKLCIQEDYLPGIHRYSRKAEPLHHVPWSTPWRTVPSKGALFMKMNTNSNEKLKREQNTNASRGSNKKEAN